MRGSGGAAAEPNGLETRFRQDAPAVSGHLLTKLSLAQEAYVNVVDASGGGVVVMEKHVVITDCAHADVLLSLQDHEELAVHPSTCSGRDSQDLEAFGRGEWTAAVRSR